MKNRLIKIRSFVAAKGYAEPCDQYRSRFNYVWWFWSPRIHTQAPDDQNPRVIGFIWLCFAIVIDIWGDESRDNWPIEYPLTK